jgi:hypothetical protein
MILRILAISRPRLARSVVTSISELVFYFTSALRVHVVPCLHGKTIHNALFTQVMRGSFHRFPVIAKMIVKYFQVANQFYQRFQFIIIGRMNCVDGKRFGCSVELKFRASAFHFWQMTDVYSECCRCKHSFFSGRID